MTKEEAILAFDNAVAEAKASLYLAGYLGGFTDGVASVPVTPVEGEDMGLSAANEAIALAAAVEGALANVQPVIDDLRNQLGLTAAQLAAVEAVDAEMKLTIEKIKAILAL